MTGDEDDGDVDTHFLQNVLEIQSAHVRHADIENQAGAWFGTDMVEKLLRRRKSFNVQAHGTNQTGNGVAHGAIVIDEIYGWGDYCGTHDEAVWSVGVQLVALVRSYQSILLTTAIHISSESRAGAFDASGPCCSRRYGMR